MISGDHVPKLTRPEDASHLAVLLGAIKEQKSCTVTYVSPGQGKEKRYQIFPLCCFFTTDGTYVYDVTVPEEHLVIHAIERFRDIVVDGKTKRPVLQYDPASLLADPFGIALEDAYLDVEVVLDSRQGWFEAQRAWPKEFVTLQKQPDGTWKFSIHTRGRYGHLSWLRAQTGTILSISDRGLAEEYTRSLDTQLTLLGTS
ncbi:MAG: WYL domain-containing protein [Sphaerochaeta sp.]|jgi:hypothetical protein|nr:WYL domain-containing protein [Sphaerochaeta sp.]MCI2104500.1 WYL domain-containing protein [Sphaerochaeta sp.]